MLFYAYLTDRRTDGQTHQKYSSEPHKSKVIGNSWIPARKIGNSWISARKIGGFWIRACVCTFMYVCTFRKVFKVNLIIE